MPYIPNPAVIESDGRVERSMDVYSRLLRDRIIYLGTPIDDSVANLIIAQLLYLSSTDPDRDIQMHIKSDVQTVCVGLAASMGAVLLVAGTKGKRYILPNAEVMIHPGSAGFGGATPDIEIQAEHILRVSRRVNEILARHTGQPVERIIADTNRDFYMTAEEAVEYGCVDSVLTSTSVPPPAYSTNGRHSANGH